jgi:hypothetical protein
MTGTVATQVKAIAFDRDIERLTEGFTGREWVFEEVDRWLQQDNERFFILTGEPGVGKSAIAARLTQLRQDIAAYHFCIAGRSGTIEPNNVLLSLAAQLIDYFPDYAEALANTIKPLKLSINVEITIETLKDSEVRGVVIGNLHTQNPQEALNIVLRQAFAALPKPPQESKIILIDSLDEAVTFGARDSLVALLSGLNDLPPWVRLILTSRPEDRVLVEFEPLKPYRIEETSAESRADIRQYVEERMEHPALQEQLSEADVVPLVLLDQVVQLSCGNFLYTKLLLDEIETKRQSLNDLSALPKTIDDIYLAFLRRFKHEEWKSKYQPILGTLTVALEPVTEDELENFTDIKPRQLRQDLGVIRQFLDEARNEAGKTTYAIFHQSLRDYLLNKERNQHFWCDAKEQQALIIDYYKKKTQKWRQLSQIDRYGVRHLTQHLVIAGQGKKLHTLLAVETSDGQNAWFVLKDQIGDTTGFLSDIALAWDQAEHEFETNRSGLALGLQFRYSLITASFNSFASKFPVPILISLVKRAFWSIDEAIAYVEKLTDPWAQFEAVVKLSAYIPDFLNAEMSQILQERVDQLLSLKNYEKLEKQLLDAVRGNIIGSHEVLRENFVLKRLKYFSNLRVDISCLPGSMQHLINEQISTYFKRAIQCKALSSISYVEYLVDLSSYAFYMSDPTQVLELIKKEFSMRLEEEKNKAKALLEKEPVSYTGWVDDYEYESVWDYPEMGRRDLEKLDELQEKFMNMISSKIDQAELESLTSESLVRKDFLINSDIQLAEAINSLGTNKSGEKLAELIYRSSDQIINSTVSEVLKLIRRIDDGNLQKEMLIKLIPYVKKTLREQILLQEFKATSSIWKLKPYLAQFQDAKVWEEVFEECKKELRNVEKQNLNEITKIFGKISDIFPYCEQSLKIKECRLIYNSDLPLGEKIEVIEEFILHSSGQAKNECLAKINLLKADQKQRELKEQLRKLDHSFPELLEKQETQQLLDYVKSTENTFNRLFLTAKLLPYLPEVSQEGIIKEILEAVGIMTTIESISNSNLNEEMLSGQTDINSDSVGISNIFRKLLKFSLFEHPPITQKTEGNQKITTPLIEDEYERWLILRELILVLPEYLQETILPVFLSYEKANAKRYSRRRRFHRIMDLIEVGRALPELPKKKIFEKALKIFLKPTSSRSQDYALLKLISYLPNSSKKKAINAAFTIDSEESLNKLLPDLSKSQLKEVLQDTLLLEDELDRVYRLGFLVPHLPNSLQKEVVSQAINFAQSLDFNQSHEILSKLLPYLPKSVIDQFTRQVIDSIHEINFVELQADYSVETQIDSLIDSLTALRPYLPKTLISKALQAASSIQDEKIRAEILETLLPCATDPLTDLYPQWKDYLRTLSNQDRQHWLSVMSSLAPIIKPLGGKEAVEEAVYAVQDIGRWYP